MNHQSAYFATISSPRGLRLAVKISGGGTVAGLMRSCDSLTLKNCPPKENGVWLHELEIQPKPGEVAPLLKF